MTWLPIHAASLPERDAVLGLKPEVHARLRELLTLAWQITDARLLDLCRLRLAQMMATRAELAGADDGLLVDLDGWRSRPAFSDRERAALAYAEQYHWDHKQISYDQHDVLARHLSPRELVNFVWALHLNDAYVRVLSLLDIEPDPPSSPVRPERVPVNERQPRAASEPGASRGRGAFADLDPEFREAYGVLGRAVVKQTLVDDVTSEVVRLHNASHQGCLY
jgi:hypothetical protein